MGVNRRDMICDLKSLLCSQRGAGFTRALSYRIKQNTSCVNRMKRDFNVPKERKKEEKQS